MRVRALFNRRVKFTILVVGILLMVFGWYLDHAEQRELAARIFARDYVQALNAYERMLDEVSEIGPTDPGFAQIVSILSGKLSGSGDLTISKVRIKRDNLWAVKTDGYEGPTIALEITLRDGRSVTAGSVKDLRPEIRERFLERALFLKGELVFWLGIIVTLISAVVEFFGFGES